MLLRPCCATSSSDFEPDCFSAAAEVSHAVRFSKAMHADQPSGSVLLLRLLHVSHRFSAYQASLRVGMVIVFGLTFNGINQLTGSVLFPLGTEHHLYRSREMDSERRICAMESRNILLGDLELPNEFLHYAAEAYFLCGLNCKLRDRDSDIRDPD